MAPGASLGHVILQQRPQFARRSRNVHEVGWHDTNDLIAAIVKGYEPAHDVHISSELPLPQSVAENNFGSPAGTIFRSAEDPPQSRKHTENTEVRRADTLSL